MIKGFISAISVIFITFGLCAAQNSYETQHNQSKKAFEELDRQFEPKEEPKAQPAAIPQVQPSEAPIVTPAPVEPAPIVKQEVPRKETLKSSIIKLSITPNPVRVNDIVTIEIEANVGAKMAVAIRAKGSDERPNAIYYADKGGYFDGSIGFAYDGKHLRNPNKPYGTNINGLGASAGYTVYQDINQGMVYEIIVYSCDGAINVNSAGPAHINPISSTGKCAEKAENIRFTR